MPNKTGPRYNKEDVFNELNLILQDIHFRNSVRRSKFLVVVVKATLAKQPQESINVSHINKTLGEEVKSGTIRTAIGDIRYNLGLYYNKGAGCQSSTIIYIPDDNPRRNPYEAKFMDRAEWEKKYAQNSKNHDMHKKPYSQFKGSLLERWLDAALPDGVKERLTPMVLDKIASHKKIAALFEKHAGEVRTTVQEIVGEIIFDATPTAD